MGVVERCGDVDAQLAEADSLIEAERYNDAVAILTRLVACDEQQLERAESRFARIREIRDLYIAKGFEVRDALRRILSDPGIREEEVIPRAIEALTLISEMTRIIPYPNPEEERLVTDLRARVRLTVDQRRFLLLMAQAADALGARGGPVDYAKAVALYAGGPDPDIDLPEQTPGGVDPAEFVRLRGLDLQRDYFDVQDYGLASTLFAGAREQVRDLAVGDASLLTVAEPSLAEAERLIALFGAGEFADARSQIEAYLPTLEQVASIHRRLEAAALTIAAQESDNERRSSEPGYVYDNHVRFVNDLVNGRSGQAEGILHIATDIRLRVTEGPVEATRAYGAEQYDRAVRLLSGFGWESVSAPGGIGAVQSHVAEADGLLEAAAVSYRTSIEIVSVANTLGLVLPAAGAAPSSTTVARLVADLEVLLAGIEDDDERAVAKARILEAFVRVASAEDLRQAAAIARQAFETGSSLRSQTVAATLSAQRTDLRSRLDALARLRDAWDAFVSLVERTHPGEASAVLEPAAAHASYLRDRSETARTWERAIVREIARIELAALDARLSASRSTIAGARQSLAATAVEQGEVLARPRPDTARDALVPLVGRVSGTTILDASGSLQQLRSDAEAFVVRYEREEPYIVTDAALLGHVASARQIAATVGTTTSGIFLEARNMLQDALNRIASSEENLNLGRARIREIDNEIDAANAASRDGNIERAGELIGRANTLLRSGTEGVRDALGYFTATLASWYRPAVEAEWERESTRLEDRIREALNQIVFVEVDRRVAVASPLVEARQFQDASDVLEPAQSLWQNAFPTVQHPQLTPLLWTVRTALSEAASRTLREDLPGFERLSQLLNTAATAYEQGDLATANQALVIFRREQPLNFEARLLETRVEFRLGTGTRDSLVRALTDAALDEAGVSRALLAQGGSAVTDAVRANLLPLETKLRAIEQVIRELGGVSAAETAAVVTLIGQVDRVLRPPLPPPPPPSAQAQADQLLNQAVAIPSWAVQPEARQRDVWRLLEAAIEIAPGYTRAQNLRNDALRIFRWLGEYTLTPAGEERYQEALRREQMRDYAGGLRTMEEFGAIDVEVWRNSKWNTLYERLLRAQVRR